MSQKGLSTGRRIEISWKVSVGGKRFSDISQHGAGHRLIFIWWWFEFEWDCRLPGRNSKRCRMTDLKATAFYFLQIFWSHHNPRSIVITWTQSFLNQNHTKYRVGYLKIGAPTKIAFELLKYDDQRRRKSEIIDGILTVWKKKKNTDVGVSEENDNYVEELDKKQRQNNRADEARHVVDRCLLLSDGSDRWQHPTQHRTYD